ncbi:hypothetical protein [Streptomyces sp. TRM70350]|uniref:hypothetical protein n=1 Tax=Streptomyces sp. TRM70350 TaxID=2856165 RepID=UPI001C48973E|nr:hypothetical protein [Streptomyces sp. TRM70350]MBV7696563.1 hypothetical protein [Streptomyces sp. TRM70350]
MRISALHAAAVLAAGTLAFGSGTAFADTPSTPAPQATDAPASPGSAAHVSVDAPTVAPGGTVHIDGTCAVPDSGPAPKLTSITSPGFVGGTAKVTKDRPDAFTATATAVQRSGPYQVTVKCSNGEVSTSFTVDSPTPSPTPKPTRSPGRAESARVFVSSTEVRPGTEVSVSGTVATDSQGNPIGTVKAVESAGFQGRSATLDKTDPLAFTGHATAVRKPGRYVVKLIGSEGTARTTFQVLGEHTDSGGSDSGGGTHHDGTHPATPSPHVTPNGAPATGEFDPASDSSKATVNVGQAVGAALGGFLAGAGGAGLVMRRRRTGTQR